ncbi:Dexh-box atp-dependent rna helicase dexh10 [Thalictrum thalictroides]|uniref:Dexh-box atp-dependent rna helicase dexh10 n=1 Tax=Thalictrum thalictroides TaxID=46969 RepID=A0A7J6VT37_THATH|nr:Dexh-box atp-dependent rna helicase dexh10 [Thalictrum thalictroides]
MHVVPVQLPLICALSKIRIAVPSDLRPVEARQNILMAVQELGSRFPHGLPMLNPVKDMGIEDPELLVELVNQIEKKLFAHPLHKSSQDTEQIKCVQRKAEVNHEIQQLKAKMSLESCFIPRDKSNEQIHLRTEHAKPLQQLQDSVRRIAEIQLECKLEVNVDEYVESTVRPYLMDVIYCWFKGCHFCGDYEMTEIFEASIIRLARRLDEFFNQLCAAAHAVGEVDLENKFAVGSESLQRDIMFSNSMYL